MQIQKQSRFNPIHLFIDYQTRIPVSYRIHSEKFAPKVSLSFEKSGFTVKTAETERELERVLQLRYEIFHREFKGSLIPFGIDFEPLDIIADHLIVVENDTQRIVGTYRLISSSFSDTFYSQSEFEMEEFLDTRGVKLEMSRAGIQKDFRNGLTMALLWRGVSEYMKKVNASFIFGCASIKTWSPFSVEKVVDFLSQSKSIDGTYNILPKKNYQMPNGEPFFRERKPVEIPSLMKGYLKAGAKVSPMPAWDRDFRCVDFLTILEVAAMDRTFEKRYVKSSVAS